MTVIESYTNTHADARKFHARIDNAKKLQQKNCQTLSIEPPAGFHSWGEYSIKTGKLSGARNAPLESEDFFGDVKKAVETRRARLREAALSECRVDHLPADYVEPATHLIDQAINKILGVGEPATELESTKTKLKQVFLADQYTTYAHSKNRIDKAVYEAHKKLPLSLDSDYFDVREYATEQADKFSLHYIKFKKLRSAGQLELANEYANQKKSILASKLGWAPAKDVDHDGMFLRAQQSKFWLRRINKKLTMSNIQAARILGTVGLGHMEYDPTKTRSQYLPFHVVQRAHEQIKMTKDWLSTTIIRSGADSKTLDEITKVQQLHQLKERELRTRAQCELAHKRGLIGFLMTITLPSRFHSMKTVGNGRKKWSVANKNFDPTLTPIDGAKWKQKRWVLFRANLAKLLKKNGYDKSHWDFFSATEGHTDATPHWHSVLYVPADLYDQVRKLIFSIFLYERDGNIMLTDEELEAGAKKHRVDLQPFKKENGAIRYVMKMLRYPLKNIGGDEDKPSAEALFARKIGVRSFNTSKQSIGNWRWLRACKDPDFLPAELQPAWYFAHGLDPETDKIEPYPKTQFGQIDDSTPRKYFDHKSCCVEHMINYLTSVGIEYKPLYFQSDFFDVQYKTLADYADENGEITRESYDQYTLDRMITAGSFSNTSKFDNDADNDQNSDIDDQDEELLEPSIKRKKRKLNQFNEPAKPGKHQMLYRVDQAGTVHIGRDKRMRFWERDENASAELRASKLASKRAQKEKEIEEKKQKSTIELQLLIHGRGAASRPESRTNTGFKQITLEERLRLNEAHTASLSIMSIEQIKSTHKHSISPAFHHPPG
ncbi:replication endonuclease [Allopusillimonas ginsengisoli]|uniref:replication endonuclease n=1 Tax=Allopusillimonas ginsengisoli TaxID=453575 RepID=UPI00101EB5D4|nr:replication endonuclease [Allopusillimonas ginsengisoli]TEA79492.1 hypothetical protein ERE07_00580 [Allopusillimonas ginsengisoli]